MAKIMVVDDEDDVRNLLKTILQSYGYRVVLAENGGECLSLVSKFKPDLILLDLLMPGIQAEEILSQLKEYRIVIFSVVTLEEKYIAETGKKYPVTKEYPNIVANIKKPINIKAMLSIIKQSLKKKIKIK